MHGPHPMRQQRRRRPRAQRSREREAEASAAFTVPASAAKGLPGPYSSLELGGESVRPLLDYHFCRWLLASVQLQQLPTGRDDHAMCDKVRDGRRRRIYFGGQLHHGEGGKELLSGESLLSLQATEDDLIE